MKLKELREIFKDDNDGRLVLPNFQRDFVWDEKQQKELLATFLVELPISSILLLKGNPDDFNYRKLCFKEENHEAKEECLYLLDGQQRMSTLKSIFTDFFKESNTEIWNKLYGRLVNAWFIRVKPIEEDDTDIFGYEKLNFDNENLREFTPQEVLDSIEVFRIYKTKKEWYHPEKKNINNKEFRDKCIIEHLIPLNGLVENKKMIQNILRTIADNRMNEIFYEIGLEEDEKIKLEKIKKYFDNPEEYREINSIEEFEKQKDILKCSIPPTWVVKIANFLEKLLYQEISLIEIEKNKISRGIAIFETINKGGTPLDNFDLIVAKAAKDSKEKALAQRIRELFQEDIIIPKELTTVIEKWTSENLIENSDEISKKIKNQYLNILSIFFHVGNDYEKLKLEHIKRDKIFEITSEGINQLTEKTIKALLRALAFCNLRLGIVKLNDLSFDLMLLPLAYLLIKDEIWNDRKALDRIEYWYWVSVFSGRYREKQNIRAIEDLKTLYKWIIEKEKNNEKVKELVEEKIKRVLLAEEYSDKETLKNKEKTPQAIEKGILSYILTTNPFDLQVNEEKKLYSEIVTDKNFKLEDHHIIPLGGDKKLGQVSSEIRKNKAHILNSVLNRTLISDKANKDISNLKLADYISQIREICRISHFIPKELEKKENETLEMYWTRLAELRYEAVKESLLKELYSLRE